MTIARLACCIIALVLSAAAATEIEWPTDNIVKNYEWCGGAATAEERLLRFEAFWRHYHPDDEQYDDAVHHTFVRHTAYRLARLYAEAKAPEKCAEMLAWLEAHDQALPR